MFPCKSLEISFHWEINWGGRRWDIQMEKKELKRGRKILFFFFFSLLFAHIGFWLVHLRFVWPLSFSHFLLFTTLQTYLYIQRNSSTNMDPFSFPLHFGAGLSQRPWSQRTDRARFNSSCRTVKQTAAALFSLPTFISSLPRFRLSASSFSSPWA